MTFEEMCNILAQEYPEIVPINVLDLQSSDFTQSYSGYVKSSLSITTSLFKCTVTGTAASVAGTCTIKSNKAYKMTGLTSLKLVGTIGWDYWAVDQNNIYIKIRSEETGVTETLATFTNRDNYTTSGSINKTISLPNTVGNYYIEIVITEMGDRKSNVLNLTTFEFIQ